LFLNVFISFKIRDTRTADVFIASAYVDQWRTEAVDWVRARTGRIKNSKKASASFMRGRLPVTGM